MQLGSQESRTFMYILHYVLAITCGTPMKPNEMTMNQADTPNNFLLGHKLTLRCNKGFNLIGNPFIFCLANGKWSTVMSHCSSK